MTLEEFIKKYTGKYIDWDGVYGAQCVDLYRFYCKEVLEVPQSPPIPGAADIWNNYLTAYFDKITNTPEGVPTKGDVMIWSKNTGGGYGHVAIFYDGTVSKFRSFDQNWPTGSPCQLVSHYYKNVLGWLRPKGGVMETFLGKSKEYWLQVEKDREDLLKKVGELEKEIDRLRDEWKSTEEDYKIEIASLKDRNVEEKKRYTDFVATIAKLLDVAQSEPEITANLKQLIDIEEQLRKERLDFKSQIDGMKDNLIRKENEYKTLENINFEQRNSIESLSNELKAVKIDLAKLEAINNKHSGWFFIWHGIKLLFGRG
jgi:hypothetical protein